MFLLLRNSSFSFFLWKTCANLLGLALGDTYSSRSALTHKHTCVAQLDLVMELSLYRSLPETKVFVSSILSLQRSTTFGFVLSRTCPRRIEKVFLFKPWQGFIWLLLSSMSMAMLSLIQIRFNKNLAFFCLFSLEINLVSNII